MAVKLLDLMIDKLALVVGKDYQPANPQSKVLVYKSACDSAKTSAEGVATDATAVTGKGDQMADKQQQQAPVEQAQGLLAKAKELIDKATRTYESSSRSVETFEADPAPAAPVYQSAPEMAELVKVTASVAETLAKVAAGQAALDSRLAAVEKASLGSQALGVSFTRDETEKVKLSKAFPAFQKYLEDFSRLAPGQRLSKATIVTSGWNYGLKLDEADKFLQYVVDMSVLMKAVRRIPMNGPTKRIPKIDLTGNVYRKGTQGTAASDSIVVADPTMIDLAAKEIVAAGPLSYDVLEDNVEGDAFMSLLMQMVLANGANQLDAAIFHGDTGVADASGINDRWDGYLKKALAGGTVIEGMTLTNRNWPGTRGAKASLMKASLADKYKMDPSKLRFILNPTLVENMNDELAALGYSEAFNAITGLADVPLRSIKSLAVPAIKTDLAFTYSAVNYTDGTPVVLCDPANLILGMLRDVTIETDRLIRSRAIDTVISMRADVEIENAAAIVVIKNLKTNNPSA